MDSIDTTEVATIHAIEIIRRSIDVELTRPCEEVHEEAPSDIDDSEAIIRQRAESERLMVQERGRADEALGLLTILTRETKEHDLQSRKLTERIDELEEKLAVSDKERKEVVERTKRLQLTVEDQAAKIQALEQIIRKSEIREASRPSIQSDSPRDQDKLILASNREMQIEIERLQGAVKTLVAEREVLFASVCLGALKNGRPPSPKNAPSSLVTEEMRRKERVARALAEYEREREEK